MRIPRLNDSTIYAVHLSVFFVTAIVAYFAAAYITGWDTIFYRGTRDGVFRIWGGAQFFTSPIERPGIGEPHSFWDWPKNYSNNLYAPTNPYPYLILVSLITIFILFVYQLVSSKQSPTETAEEHKQRKKRSYRTIFLWLPLLTLGGCLFLYLMFKLIKLVG
jgi:hypothetical protein